MAAGTFGNEAAESSGNEPGAGRAGTDEDRHESEVHRFVVERLRCNGQRYTAKRRAVVDALKDAPHPLTMVELLERAPSVAQSSAYRNLVVLEDAEVVERIVTADDFARYELSHDLSGHHHHLVCSVCGTVVDFELPEALEAALDEALHAAARRSTTGRGHFAVMDHQLDVIGTCAACSNG